jgi:hypothetical protein
MDAGEFVQENKRWLLGCGIGAVAWLVVSMVFDSVHAATLPTERSLGAPTGPVYTQAALDAARAEGEELAKARASLQQALAFTPGPRYQLDDKGRPGDQLFQASRDLKQKVLAAANQRDVQVTEGGLVWEIPTGIDEIRATLFGLELVDELQQRLFAAHDAVRVAKEEAMGLRAVLGVKLEARRGQRGPTRNLRAGELDLREHFVQEQGGAEPMLAVEGVFAVGPHGLSVEVHRRETPIAEAGVHTLPVCGRRRRGVRVAGLLASGHLSEHLGVPEDPSGLTIQAHDPARLAVVGGGGHEDPFSVHDR